MSSLNEDLISHGEAIQEDSMRSVPVLDGGSGNTLVGCTVTDAQAESGESPEALAGHQAAVVRVAEGGERP